MNRTEITPIDIGTPLSCDIALHHQRIAKKIGIAPTGEPIGRLSPRDMDRYNTAIFQKSGLCPQDAKKVRDTVSAEYEKAIEENDEVKIATITLNVRSATEGLLGVEKRKPEFDSLPQEATVFEG